MNSSISNNRNNYRLHKKIKAALTGSDNQLRLANNKAQELSIKKLTKNAPSVAEKFNKK